MKQAFDPNSFNFTKMDKREIIFEVINKDRDKPGNVFSKEELNFFCSV